MRVQPQRLADGEAQSYGKQDLRHASQDGHPSHVGQLGEGELDAQGEEEQGHPQPGDVLHPGDVDVPARDVVADNEAGQ